MRALIASTLISLGVGQALGTPPVAADYWRLRPHYQPQITDSACSVASVAMALAALGGGRVDQAALLRNDVAWRAETLPGGEGVSLAELVRHLRDALSRHGLRQARIELFRPASADAADLARLRAILAEAAGNADTVVLVSFDQGWLWGEPSVGHISPVGDYDAATGQVLVMDVDNAHFGAIRVHETALLTAMTQAGNDDPDGAILIRR